MKKTTVFGISAVCLAPLVFLAAIWQNLPDRVPMHYNFNGEIDRYGSKNELLTLIGFLFALNIGLYLLLSNIHRIDPKKKYTADNLFAMKRFAFIITFFMSALSCFIIYATLHAGGSFTVKSLVALLGLLFAALGNYMHNIKPNYFAGIRLPWTLENEENWKHTHRMAGGIWFVGGLVLTVLAFFLPPKAGFIALEIITGILVIVPVIYSYRFYRKNLDI